MAQEGVEVPALGGRIHPHYGVFSPVRGEYIDLVAQAPLPGTGTAFDIGTGTGVLAAVLARRGVRRVVATELAPRALACAQDNLRRLGLQDRVELLAADLFPPGRAPLVVCNPPWLPARPSSAIEQAVYDEGSRMLKGFLAGLHEHLEPGGEGWLVLSDWPSTWACARATTCSAGSPRPACACWGAWTRARATARPRTPATPARRARGRGHVAVAAGCRCVVCYLINSFWRLMVKRCRPK